MHDLELQMKLKALGVAPKRRVDGRAILVLLIVLLSVTSFGLGYGVKTLWPGAVVEKSNLGRLTVLAAQSSGADPMATWQEVGRYIGKQPEEFSHADMTRAVNYLANKIPLTGMEFSSEKAESWW